MADDTVPEVDVAGLASAREGGAQVMDVRQSDEYEAAHVPGAVLIPLDQLVDRMAEVPPGPLYVICKSGGRSAAAVRFLAGAGVAATNVAGGTMAWVDAGYPVATGSAPA